MIDIFKELEKIANPLNASFGAPDEEDEDHWISYPLFYDDEDLSREIFVYVFIDMLGQQEEEDTVVIQARVGQMLPGMSFLGMLSDSYHNTFSRVVVIADSIDNIEVFMQASLPLSLWNADVFKRMVEEVAVNADFWAMDFERWQINDLGEPPVN